MPFHLSLMLVAATFHQWCLIDILSILGCTPKSMIIGQMTGLVDDGVVAFEGDHDLELVEKALPANIKLLSRYWSAAPTIAV